MPTVSALNSRLFQQVKSCALELGFDHCALTRPEIPSTDRAAYLSWCEEGGAAGMEYMTRDSRKRLDIETAFPGARAVLTLGISYYQGERLQKPGPGFGRVARYAWGLDYHPVINDRLQKLAARLSDIFGGGVQAVPAIDTKPVLERALASAAGLGFIGKNTVLIIPQPASARYHIGSWIFLAELLLNIPIDGVTEQKTTGGCGGCTKCLQACPTDAFERPYRLNSGKCISYLTIENKGWIPTEMRAAVGDWIFGCDVCQEVCPFNARAYETRWPEFQADQGVGPWVSIREVLETVDAAQFKAKWGHTPLGRPKWKGMLRNACVVAGNSEDPSLVPALRALLSSPEPMVRGHALWALGRLAPAEARNNATQFLRNEMDEQVKQECRSILAA